MYHEKEKGTFVDCARGDVGFGHLGVAVLHGENLIEPLHSLGSGGRYPVFGCHVCHLQEHPAIGRVLDVRS